MADRHFGEALCQGGKDSQLTISDAKVVDPILQQIRSDDGEGDVGSCRTIQPLSPLLQLWQPWKTNSSPCALEIFAGCGRHTQHLRHVGIRAYAIDTCLNPGDDVLQPDVEYRILEMIFSGKVLFVWLGMPCTSFSVSRKGDGLGPGPLRSNEQPMGLGGLNKRDQQKVLIGNLLLFFSARVIWACLQCRIPFALENPFSSRCWLTPTLVLIKDYCVCQFIHLDFGQFGESWKKPTGILRAFVNLHEVAVTCQGTHYLCSRTGKKHIPLQSLSADHRFMTAQPYPLQMTKKLSESLAKQLFPERSAVRGERFNF